MDDNTPRPCKLQVNTSGAWRNILDFDAKDEEEVLHHAAQLFAWATPNGSLRIIMPGETAPLMNWTREKGWREWRTEA